MSYVPLQITYGRNGLTGEVDGWRVLTICILLNRTSRGQVRQVLDDFFEEFPDAVYAVEALCYRERHERMEALLMPLGFGHTRTRRIAQFSVEWVVHPHWRDVSNVTRFTGCGQYAQDAWRIFVAGNYSVPSEDGVLERWRAEMRDNDRTGSAAAQDRHASVIPLPAPADRGHR